MNDEMIKRLSESLLPYLTGTYDCIRVWEAWSVGTMGEDDFEEVSENPERLNEIAQAVISALTPADLVALVEEKLTGWKIVLVESAKCGSSSEGFDPTLNF